MNKVVITVFLSASSFLFSASVLAAPLLFDFESDSIGSQPAGWSSPFGSSVGGGGSISNQQASAGTQSMLVSGIGGTARSVGRLGSFSAAYNSLSIDLYAPGTNGTTGNNFFIGIYGGFRFDLYQNGSANTVDLNLFDGNLITNIARDEWFTVQLDFDWDNGLANAFLDGNLVASAVSFTPNLSGGGPGSDLTFQGMHSIGAGGVAGHTFVDNIILSEASAAPEPHTVYLLLSGLLLLTFSKMNIRAQNRLS